MKQHILLLFTRTPLHVGAGASVGAIDQPVQRERHTGFPIIPGSSIKGVLRSTFQDQDQTVIDALFGKGADSDAQAGALSFGEARMVVFPVRSSKGAFAFAVSPLSLSRLARDAGWSDLVIPEEPQEMHCLAGSKIVFDKKNSVALEEYVFECSGSFPADWEQRLTSLLSDAVLSSSAGRFVLLSNGDLSYFAVNACTVQQHVKINPETGTSVEHALFNEETVPSETLFYSPVNILRPQLAANNPVFDTLTSEYLLQFGGDGTTGLGFCTAKLMQESQST